MQDGNWPVSHMRRLWCARRKSGGGGRAWRRGGGGGPHYKFNLTNGSENLETMEYMKCGRVYHDGRHGVVRTGNIVRADPYSPGTRKGGWGWRATGPNIEGRTQGEEAKHPFGTARSREIHARFLSLSNHHA